MVGGYFDHEFREQTWRLFEAFRRGEARLVISDLTLRELEPAPQFVRDLINELPKEVINATTESLDLAPAISKREQWAKQAGRMRNTLRLPQSRKLMCS